jgi:hypothetical protein
MSAKWLTTGRAADLAEVSQDMIRKLADSRELTTRRLTPRGPRLILADDVRALLERATTPRRSDEGAANG